jgi:aconitate hydratase
MNEPRGNSFGTLTTLPGTDGTVKYYRLDALAEQGVADVGRLPRSIRVLLEAALRAENGREVTREDVLKIATYDPKNPPRTEIPFLPARVLLQDFTGVPCVVDLAAMRDAMKRLGGDPRRINPRIPVDLVIDHSVQVDYYGTADAVRKNSDLEFQRNGERYEFLAWGQQAFSNFRVVPPASGICHQVNLEYLGQGVRESDNGDGTKTWFFDSCVGTDSHTPMINGLGVVGWGVGGIEAEAVMLGQPIYLVAPPVVGFRLTGRLPEGTTATDMVLTITQMLRKKGVVDQFVEFFGPGVAALTVPDRATIANMSPEAGNTIGFFPIDEAVLGFLRGTNRGHLCDRVEKYAKAQGLWPVDGEPDPDFVDVLELDLGTVVPCISGPKRPQDRVALSDMKAAWRAGLTTPVEKRGFGLADADLARTGTVTFPQDGTATIGHGAVTLAAITSCTNTSNPSVLLAAGILAKKARAKGLTTKPYVKTSLAPGSTVVTEYLTRSGLLPSLEELGFHVVGYGCTTCIGNSGPLPEHVRSVVKKGSLVVSAVLSGNRNFEGRVHADIKAAYLASPPLVVAYAIAGTTDIDLLKEPLGTDPNGAAVYLKDVWPTDAEVAAALPLAMDPEVFQAKYGDIEHSNPDWNAIPVAQGDLYAWDEASTYIQNPPFFATMGLTPGTIAPIAGARVLAYLGDSITTDHISPAGNIALDTPAAKYLAERGVVPKDFNQYGSRRGNDRIMTRGTFANVRLRNRLAGGVEGGLTTHLPTGERLAIYDAAVRYQAAGIPTVVLGGLDYGMGSSRDWAAKGTYLLGVRAVIARSFERIHRSNLVGMGVLPLMFQDGATAESLGLTGEETFAIAVGDDVKPGQAITVTATAPDGSAKTFTATCRLDSAVEVNYFRNGGILQTVLRGFLQGA